MSKRSRKERRTGQIERAVSSADPGTLQALVDKNPEAAAPLVMRAMEQLPEDATKAGPIEVIALRLAKQLRRAGKPSTAIQLAASGARKSAGFRMEEALAAFALGRDETAAEIAAVDPAVALALDPLLRAVRGEKEPRKSPGRKVTSTTPIPLGLAALHSVARAVGFRIQGEASKCRAALKTIDKMWAPAVLAREIDLAMDLGNPRLSAFLIKQLAATPIVGADSELRNTMTDEAAASIPDVGPPLAGAPLAGNTNVARRRLRDALLASTSAGTAVSAIRPAEVDLFPESERASAAIYKGFGLYAEQPAEATRCFDRAIQLGGDLVEALRGKAIAAQRAAGDPRGGPGQEQRVREVAATSERLARALAHDPRGRPFAAFAEKTATDAHLALGDVRSALAAIGRARPLAGGALVGELDLLEAEALAQRDPKEAAKKLDALLERDPSNLEAWKGRLAMAIKTRDEASLAQIVFDAAAATKDPKFVAEARKIRMDRGEGFPFDGLMPGATTPGAVAAELSLAFERGGEGNPLERARPFREALSPEGRFAVDFISIALTVIHGEEHEGVLRLMEVFEAWKHSPRDIGRIASAALLVDLGENIFGAAKVIEDVEALRAVADAMIVAGEGSIAGRVLPRLAAGMSRSSLNAYKKLIQRAKHDRIPIPGVPSPGDVAQDIDRSLAPEQSLAKLLDDDLDDDDDDDDDFEPGFEEDPFGGGLFDDFGGLPPLPKGIRLSNTDRKQLFAIILSSLGAPPDTFNRLSKEQQLELERKLMNITTGPPDHESANQMLDLLESFGVRINPEMSAPFGPRRAGRKKKR